MTTVAQPHGADEPRDRAELADLIDTCKDEIAARWVDRVGAELEPGVGVTQLRDAMPDYLARLALALRSTDPLSRSGSAVWQDVAREHALTRVRLGFDIDQLVREFIVLRQVLSEVAGEHARSLNAPQAARIADLVEAAIAVAVRSYAEARDYSARRKQAEHVAFVTHELRNPLSAVKLAAIRVRRDAPPTSERALQILDRNVGRLEDLINSVLQAERLQAGQLRPHIVDVTLGDLLARPVATARMAAAAKGLTLHVRYDAGLLVRADRELAATAISNVLDNAVRFTSVGEVRATAEPSADRVTLDVWDNCAGLSEEELRVIFEPFERTHSNRPGVGLGLAIARRVLDAQGGAIGAESTADRGCHFWITLPRAAH